MLFGVIQVDEDVIQVNNYRDVNHVGKDVIHEPLEISWGIGKPFGHHQPLKEPVVGAEGGFPFIPSHNACTPSGTHA